MLLPITGATGKVGIALIARIASDAKWCGTEIRALCHNRLPQPIENLEVIHGSIAGRADVKCAMAGVSHVVHLATCKEVPERVMDVSVNGLFWLLERFRTSPTAPQFILPGGDAREGDGAAGCGRQMPHRRHDPCAA